VGAWRERREVARAGQRRGRARRRRLRGGDEPSGKGADGGQGEAQEEGQQDVAGCQPASGAARARGHVCRHARLGAQDAKAAWLLGAAGTKTKI